MFSNSS